MRAHEQGIWDCWWAFCVYAGDCAHLLNSSKKSFRQDESALPSSCFYGNSATASICAGNNRFMA